MDVVISESNRRANPLLQRIKLMQGDIAQQDTGAVVSLLPQNLEFRGEINTALEKACGESLDDFILDNIYKPRPGDVYAVPGYKLSCQHIFFGIVPYWKGDFEREDVHLLSVCRKAMELMTSMGLKSISFPPLGSGKHGFPKPRAARLILQGIIDRLHEDHEEIRIVCPDKATAEVFRARLSAIGWTGLDH
jgi:O-acetyl-ADP-ribose deacetylase (regulator of RNase III)